MDREQHLGGEEVVFLSPQPSHPSPCPRDQEADDAPTKRRAPSKRSSYASRACLECQKRKIKCSGNQPGPCRSCSTNNWDCVYNTGPRKRRGVNKDNPDEQPGTSSSSLAKVRSPDRRYSEAQQDLLSRLNKLEQEWELEKARRSSTTDITERSLSLQLQASIPATSQIDEIAFAFPGSPYGSSNADLTNPNPVPDTDDNNRNSSAEALSVAPSPQRCSFVDRNSLPVCCRQDLMLWSDKNAAGEIDAVHRALERFFDLLNPHYPCLNRTQLLAQLDDHAATSATAEPSIATAQFVALVHLVIALLAILEETCTREGYTPGWTRFQQAAHLLTHTSWMSNGNLLTVQCMIIKAKYLLYAEKFNASYEAAGQAVRLCYLTGLHNQNQTQDQQNMSPFEEHMRQRVFWSLYCLERNISQVCGVPYSIRDSDIRVPLPEPLDDRAIGHTEQLPDATPLVSCIPYLWSTIKWARLSSEIWDRLFCANATKPADEEFIVSMDARIRYLHQSLPTQLQWQKQNLDSDSGAENGTQQLPPFIARQAMILHLRTNHLRLLLRREDILSPEFRSRDQKECLAIAVDTVNAVHDFYFSPAAQPLQRYSCVAYLTAALIALAAILLGPSPPPETLDSASQTFAQALRVLRHIAPGLSMARHTLDKLGPVIAAFEKTMMSSSTALDNPLNGGVEVPSVLETQASDKNHELVQVQLDATPFDFGMVDDGFVRMSYTPAFDVHYWDPQLMNP